MRRSPRGAGEEASITLYALITLPVLFAGVGLVVDGGYAMVAKSRAISDAFAAARAGAEALSEPTYAATATVVLDPVAARDAALGYLNQAGAGAGAVVNVGGNEVSVSVRLTDPTRLLDLFGLSRLTVTGSGSATATYGVQGARN